jgi:hypothetical protein
LGLAAVEAREADGRPKRSQSPTYEKDAAVGPLQARCRHAGKEPTAANMRTVTAQSFEGEAGMAINAGAKDAREVERLWQVFTGLDGAEARYYRLYIGVSRHAKTAKIEMEPEPIETRPDDRPDLRDEDERARDAVNGWMRWQGYLGHLAAYEQTAIHDALKQRCDMQREGRLTTAGQSFIHALRRLADVVEQG